MKAATCDVKIRTIRTLLQLTTLPLLIIAAPYIGKTAAPPVEATIDRTRTLGESASEPSSILANINIWARATHSSGGNLVGDDGEVNAFSKSDFLQMEIEPEPTTSYLNPDGYDQLPLDQLSKRQQNQLWDDAYKTGQPIQSFYEKYVYGKKSRLDDLPPQARPLPMSENYFPAIFDDYKLQTTPIDDDRHTAQINERFADVGITVNGDVNFDLFHVISKEQAAGLDANSDSDSDSDLSVGLLGDDEDEQVLELGINTHDGVIVTFKAFANHDNTPEKLRLKSSELTWQAWTADCAKRKVPVSGLRYLQRNNVINIASHNVMQLAHDYAPNFVEDIPIDSNGKPLGPRYGIGVWMPEASTSNTPLAQVWTRLLSIPNIKPIAHMLADHSIDLANPAIAEIYTFPAITYNARLPHIPKSLEREASIVVVLGPVPNDSLPVSGKPGSARLNGNGNGCSMVKGKAKDGGCGGSGGSEVISVAR